MLKVACRFENVEIVEKLLAGAEDFTLGQRFFKECFKVACLSGNLEVVKLFNDSGKYIPNSNFLFDTQVVRKIKGTVKKFLFSDEVMEHMLKVCGCHTFTKTNKELMELFSVAFRQNYVRVIRVLLLENWITKGDKIDLLHLACSQGGIKVVKLLADLSLRQDIQNKDGKLPLHIACEKNSLVLAQFMSSQKDLDVNCKDKAGNTPLHIACQSGNIKLVQFLTQDKHCDQNVLNEKGQLPLHITCKQGSIELTKLVSEVVEMNKKDMKSNTPLHIAYQSGNSELIQFLTRQKFCDQSIVNNEHQLPLHIVCRHGSSKLANLVMFQGSVNVNKPDGNGNTPLHIACSKKGSLSLVKRLVMHKEIKVNVINNKEELPLHLALSTFPQLPMKLIKALSRDIDMHGKCKYYGNTPLHIAYKAANLDAIKFIVNTEDCHPYSHSDFMHYADLQIHCVCNDDKHVDILRTLVTDENINVTDSNGDTPLHVACKNNNLEAVALVLEFGSNRGIVNNHGKVPLSIACSKSLEIVKLFQPIDVNEAQQAVRHGRSRRYSPLQLAEVSTFYCVHECV